MDGAFGGVAGSRFCGCGWEALSNDKSPLFPIRIAEPVVLRPLLAYVTPEAERVKERVKEGSAFLDFPVNRTEIYPEYRDNPSELRKILRDRVVGEGGSLRYHHGGIYQGFRVAGRYL